MYFYQMEGVDFMYDSQGQVFFSTLYVCTIQRTDVFPRWWRNNVWKEIRGNPSRGRGGDRGISTATIPSVEGERFDKWFYPAVDASVDARTCAWHVSRVSPRVTSGSQWEPENMSFLDVGEMDGAAWRTLSSMLKFRTVGETPRREEGLTALPIWQSFVHDPRPLEIMRRQPDVTDSMNIDLDSIRRQFLFSPCNKFVHLQHPSPQASQIFLFRCFCCTEFRTKKRKSTQLRMCTSLRRCRVRHFTAGRWEYFTFFAMISQQGVSIRNIVGSGRFNENKRWCDCSLIKI